MPRFNRKTCIENFSGIFGTNVVTEGGVFLTW